LQWIDQAAAPKYVKLGKGESWDLASQAVSAHIKRRQLCQLQEGRWKSASESTQFQIQAGQVGQLPYL
jgi:hypothetical protein